MTEEITVRQTADEARSAVGSGQRADTSSASRNGGTVKSGGFVGGSVGRGREEAGLHPGGLQPLPQLQLGQPASRIVPVP
jgi:hypothetical protein